MQQMFPSPFRAPPAPLLHVLVHYLDCCFYYVLMIIINLQQNTLSNKIHI